MDKPKVTAWLRLPHGETDPAKRYSMPDPDELYEAYMRVHRHRFYGEGALNKDDLSSVLALASGYLSLTTHELGQECCVGKLRDVWRARSARDWWDEKEQNHG